VLVDFETKPKEILLPLTIKFLLKLPLFFE